MKILKDKGKFEILSKTDDIIGQIANAARTCYKSNDKTSPENDIKLVKNLLNRGHHAMIEFADLSVKFTNTSRGFSHEIVRHRLASFAQESTRYCLEKDFTMVVSPNHDETEKWQNRVVVKEDDVLIKKQYYGESVKNMLLEIEMAYKTLIDVGYKPEDARQILPIATEAPICVKANLREWIHIFHMRCDIYAHWEIRTVMLKLLKWCQENIPVIFDEFHFFKTKDEKEYARRVMPMNNLKDNIKHLLTVKPELKETLIKYIETLGV